MWRLWLVSIYTMMNLYIQIIVCSAEKHLSMFNIVFHGIRYILQYYSK